jgi:hypothetical protein
MRSDLEVAMARVITSRSACRLFGEDPRGYASTFDLDDSEVESLLEMQEDLISLMPGFVTKRRGNLRWNAARTLTLLGRAGDALLEEYIDTRPATEGFRQEAEAFSQFVVLRTAEMAGTVPHGQLIAELARFEQLRSATFWKATAPLRPVPPPTRRGQDGVSFDADRPIRLPVSAGLGHFEWDLRQARRYTADSVGTLQPDPCDLIFFHNGRADGIRILRLQIDQAAAVAVVRDHVGAVTARAACRAGGAVDGEVNEERVLGSLLWHGALEWA